METLGLIGFGSFGQFMVSYLKDFFDIKVYDQRTITRDVKRAGVKEGTLEEVVNQDIVVLAVPVQYLEGLLQEIQDKARHDALFVDVSSVKMRPVELMRKYLPETAELLALHPLFGPQSGASGIEGLNIVICPVKTSKANLVYRFLAYELKLHVMERTPELHDKQMAYVQALTHFIGRAVNEMDIPDVEQKTPAYQFMLDIKKNLGQDSIDLFYTIENGNPYAKGIRQQFIEELKKLDDNLNGREGGDADGG